MGCKLCSQPTRTIVARRLCFCVQSSPTRRSAWLHRFTIDYGPTIPGPLPHESVKKPWAQSPRSRKSLIKRPAMRGAWDGPGLFRIPSLSRLGKALRQITSGTTDDRMVLRERTSQATRTSETKPSPSLQRNTYVYGPATTAQIALELLSVRTREGHERRLRGGLPPNSWRQRRAFSGTAFTLACETRGSGGTSRCDGCSVFAARRPRTGKIAGPY